MRFGKTFAAYELAKRMGFKRVLILTFKPAVLAAWEEDLLTHVDFEGWQFISRPKEPGKPDISQQYAKADKSRLIVCFGSFQDFLGRQERAQQAHQGSSRMGAARGTRTARRFSSRRKRTSATRTRQTTPAWGA